MSQATWTVNAGAGYAGAAVADKTVLLFHRVGASEVLQAVELETGKAIWSTPWLATYSSSINPDNGPRCVPTVSAGKVVCYGAAGDLVCLNLTDGKTLWKKPVRRELEADDGYFGAGSSPLVIEKTVIVNVGGRKGGIVGFDLASGDEKWSATRYEASYASPITVDAGARRLALVVTRLQAVLVDPRDGTQLGEIDFGARGPTVNAATPIPVGMGKYFLTASYGVGATLVDVSSGKLQAVYNGAEIMNSQYNTPVSVGGLVIGINGREDVGRAALQAIDPLSRKIIWQEQDLGTAHLIAIGNQVLVVGLDGQVRLIDGSAQQYRELARDALPPGTYRALPALAGDRLLVRTSNEDGRSQLLCIRLPTRN